MILTYWLRDIPLKVPLNGSEPSSLKLVAGPNRLSQTDEEKKLVGRRWTSPPLLGILLYFSLAESPFSSLQNRVPSYFWLPSGGSLPPSGPVSMTQLQQRCHKLFPPKSPANPVVGAGVDLPGWLGATCSQKGRRNATLTGRYQEEDQNSDVGCFKVQSSSYSDQTSFDPFSQWPDDWIFLLHGRFHLRGTECWSHTTHFISHLTPEQKVNLSILQQILAGFLLASPQISEYAVPRSNLNYMGVNIPGRGRVGVRCFGSLLADLDDCVKPYDCIGNPKHVAMPRRRAFETKHDRWAQSQFTFCWKLHFCNQIHTFYLSLSLSGCLKLGKPLKNLAKSRRNFPSKKHPDLKTSRQAQYRNSKQAHWNFKPIL